MKIDLPVTEQKINDNIQFTYDSQKRRSPALEELWDIFHYRDLVFQLVRRDIVARYKRSLLGIAWTMLQPLGMMLVLTLVFSQLFNQIDGYAAYVLGGLMPWIFFSQTTAAAIQQSVWGGALTRRIYVPYTAFPAASIGTGLVNFVLSLIPLFAMMLIVGSVLVAVFIRMSRKPPPPPPMPPGPRLRPIPPRPRIPPSSSKTANQPCREPKA